MIAVESIAKSFGGQVLFRDLSWRIAERERIGLVGPNGAGKTTLLRLAVGLLAPTTGTVSILGGRPAASASHLGRVGFVA